MQGLKSFKHWVNSTGNDINTGAFILINTLFTHACMWQINATTFINHSNNWKRTKNISNIYIHIWLFSIDGCGS